MPGLKNGFCTTFIERESLMPGLGLLRSAFFIREFFQPSAVLWLRRFVRVRKCLLWFPEIRPSRLRKWQAVRASTMTLYAGIVESGKVDAGDAGGNGQVKFWLLVIRLCP